jgi:hypothetical protein
MFLGMMFMSQMTFAAGAQKIVVPIGQATGQMQVSEESFTLSASVSKLGDYSENWDFPGTVVDYYLDQPMSLAKDVNRVGLSFLNPESTNKDYDLMLRLLLADKRGHVYAVGTRLGAKLSDLPLTDHWRTLQSFDWNINEMGRIDPWVMMRVKPASPDYYDQPQSPMQLVGFRLVLRGQGDKPCKVTIKNITPLTADEKADPYWQIDGDQQWMRHIRKPYDNFGRYGWGPAEPGPYLKASDLRLQGGQNTLISWEILAADDWTVLASNQLAMDVQADTVIQLPLLDAGTYRVKLNAIYKSGQIIERYHQYVIHRNARGGQPMLPMSKPLQVISSAKSNVFTSTDAASLSLTANQPGQIQWALSRSDGTFVANGKTSHINLQSYLQKDSVLWLKAKLVDDGKVIDILDRVLGVMTPAPIMPAGTEKITPKVQQFAGKLRRVKGDWNEGSTPVTSDSAQVLKDFQGWLDDAVDVGYNIVELSAPWYDLNPLPGVYQFEYLDKLIALAQQRGLKVTLRIHPMIRQVPGYVPRELMTDQAGFTHGLWGGADNQLFSPASQTYRKLSNEYIATVASHYRNDPTVLGYTIESLFFDHDMLDMPWLGQAVDYSQTMRRGFITWLTNKYSSITHLNEVYDSSFVHWEQIELPNVRVVLDADGRPMPHYQPVIKDWLDYKILAISELRTGWLKAARKADPAAFLGIYNTGTTEFYLDTVKALDGVITYGSMEAQYPRETRPGMPGRFEPHAKIARTAMLVDVGLTNMLMIDQPGMHGLFNYWKPEWRVAEQPAPVKEAENRLKVWFGFMDQITKAKPLDSSDALHGAYLMCDETLLYEHGNLFYDRIHDYLKPFQHHVAASDMRAEALHAKDVTLAMLKGCPWVYVPYSSDLLGMNVVEAIKQYVQQGGTLIMEAGSGKWSLQSHDADILSNTLGLGSWQANKVEQDSVTTAWNQCTINFRTKPWNPPTNDQPTPWIHNVAGGYLQLGHWSGGKADQMVTQLKIGSGQVLAFGGVIDWLNSPGLLACLEQSITGNSVSQKSDNQVQLIKRQLVDGKTHFFVGRRFISQNDIDYIKSGHPEKVDQTAVTAQTQLQQLDPNASYTITNLLNNTQLPKQTGKQLMLQGIALQLVPGQAFVLKLETE